MKKLVHIILASLTILALWHCRPERTFINDSDASVRLSLDTVYFDTVFTTVGTATKYFKIHNPHNQFLKIENLALAGGEKSSFRINVDGISGYDFDPVELAPKDSIYVFVEATLKPNEIPDILRIQDSVVFSVNGNLVDVDLVAWGQDVHMFRDSVLDYSTTWTADKPYLIIDGLLVDTLQTLTIEPGVQIYMHRDAGIFIVGTLEMNGTLDNPIVVQGDRLETFYEDIPGQWFGIYFAPGSHSNVINYAEIYNGTFGLWADSVVHFDEPVLSISNTEINRMGYDGILGRGTTIEAYNTVIGDCGNSCVELLYEGSYEFVHCTFSNYWNDGFSNRKTPAVYVANYFAYEDSLGEVIVETRDIEKAVFKNSIIYGNRSNEIIINRSADGLLNYTVERCITKFNEDDYNYYTDPNFIGIFNNLQPEFDTLDYSYELDSLSPAIDRGRPEFAIDHPFDKNGNSRVSDKAPDLGAFERVKN